MSPKCSTKQNDSVKSSQQNNENNEVVHARRERDRCLFCCTPKVLMIISVIYLTLGIIHMITRLAYLNGCRDLYENLDSMVPSNISFDQSITPTLNVNTEYYYNSYDEIWISQSDDVSVTNTTVRIRTATKNSDGGKIVTKNGPFSYNIYLSGGTVMENFASFWTVKCVINRVEVILPQQKVANANAILSSPVNINSYGLDVKFQQNPVLYPYSINIKTTSSDIDLENISVTNASIQSTSGDIKGSISSQDELSIESTSGDIDVNANINSLNGSPFVGLKSTSGDIDFELNIPNVVVRPTINISATSGDINTDVKLASGITDSQITVKTSSGDIGLKLHDSFQGQYQIKTTSGDVSVIPGYDTSHNQKGMIGPVDSQGFLSVEATSGDVEIEF